MLNFKQICYYLLVTVQNLSNKTYYKVINEKFVMKYNKLYFDN